MIGRFHKMHGLGNDFVVIDARSQGLEMPSGRATAIADRKTGIGCDQLILLESSRNADVRMRIFNADGSEVEACGNATRAVSLLIGGDISVETQGGLLRCSAQSGGARVTLPAPRFAWEDIPLAFSMDTLDMPVNWEGLERPSAVNVGNPHIIFFVEDANEVDLERLGPLIETDPLFLSRINVNVASIVSPDAIRLRVWERGVGVTRACGTGACATAVAAIRRGLAKGPLKVNLDGGELEINWSSGSPIEMIGPATHVFTGEADWASFG